MPNSVRYFDSTMSGAPAMPNTAGKLIDVLDACLVNGFGSVTLNLLTVSSNVATATVSTGHNLLMIGNTGPVIRIEGATPSGLNGDWRITVTSATTFTFTTTGISDQSATGTITAKRAPAGFEKAFSGTNKAAYRSLDTAGTQLYLRVYDTGTSEANVVMYETMSDIDTGTGLSPTSGSYQWQKSNNGRWELIADSRGVYLLCAVNGMFFGDIVSFMDNDAFGCALVGGTGGGYTYLGYLNSTAQSSMARPASGVGASVGFSRSSTFPVTGSAYLGYSGPAFPNSTDYRLHVAPLWINDGSWRGMMPGIFNPLHGSGLSHKLIVPAQIDGTERDLMVLILYSPVCAAVDLTGPWR